MQPSINDSNDGGSAYTDFEITSTEGPDNVTIRAPTEMFISAVLKSTCVTACFTLPEHAKNKTVHDFSCPGSGFVN